jgi:hypothetical protein
MPTPNPSLEEFLLQDKNYSRARAEGRCEANTHRFADYTTARDAAHTLRVLAAKVALMAPRFVRVSVRLDLYVPDQTKED